MDKFKKVQSIIADLTDDADKFYNKSNKAAGTRVRKGMQELKNLAQDIRKEIQEMKNKAEAAAKTSTKKTTTAKKSDAKGSTKKTTPAKGGAKKK